MKYLLQSFKSLSTDQLYALLRLRQQVFVLEQKSLYEDLDELDQRAMHLQVVCESTMGLAAYARLRVDSEDTRELKIERVVVASEYRGQGLGAEIMTYIMNYVSRQGQWAAVKLSAQTSVLGFYQRWGFSAFGPVYDDGGIEHMDMKIKIQM